MNNNHNEEILYRIIGKLSNSNSPFIFKGALVTKLILLENSFDEISRETRDIDANWVGKAPTMEHLVDSISNALGDLQETYEVEASRDYDDKISAGISLINRQTGRKEISIDINIKKEESSKIYYYGDTQFRGVLVDSILSDKISVLSSDILFRRAKDLIDVYALSHCADISTNSISINLKRANRKLGDFYAFINETEKLEHAYNALKGISGKPDFKHLYDHLNQVLIPFMERVTPDLQWNISKGKWEPSSQIKRLKELDTKARKDLEDKSLTKDFGR